ncbi:MAG TPA: AglZ/HisF2 family acetamidino modification protein [Flavisolibacter sp.]
MFRPRVIPVLLLHEGHLVKSVGFKGYRYIGDPLNAVRIFNELEADELIFLDIDAARNRSVIAPDLVRSIGEEASMPFAVGGGISQLTQIAQLLSNGAERVIIGSAAAIRPAFIEEASSEFGSSTITVCIDVKKDFFGRERVWVQNGRTATGRNPVEFAELMEASGAGEIILQSIKRDGSMNGYDYDLIKKVASAVSIPVVALGGAGNMEHLKHAFANAYANAVAAGSMFVYCDTNRGVLINYPSKDEIRFEISA